MIIDETRLKVVEKTVHKLNRELTIRQDYSNYNFSEFETSYNFRSCNFMRSYFIFNSKIVFSVFDACSFDSAVFSDCEISATFISCTFTSAAMLDCDFKHSVFIDCDFLDAKVESCKMHKAGFHDCIISPENWDNCSFDERYKGLFVQSTTKTHIFHDSKTGKAII